MGRAEWVARDALRLSKCCWSRLQPTTHDAPSGGLHGLNRHAAHKMPNARVYKDCVLLHPPQAASSTSVPALVVLLQRLLVGVSPREAGPRFATPHLFATPCIRTSSQSIPSWRNPFHAKRPPVDCYKPSALWPAIVNFTYSQALSAALSYSVPT